MTQGFAINQEAMKTFKDHVSQIVTAYETIKTQLEHADLAANPAAKETLLCDPVHHVGPPADFARYSKDLVDGYGQLLQRFHTAFVAASAQVNHIVQALGETQELYAELDNRHAEIFNNLLKSFAPEPGGDDHGATR